LQIICVGIFLARALIAQNAIFYHVSNYQANLLHKQHSYCVNDGPVGTASIAITTSSIQ